MFYIILPICIKFGRFPIELLRYWQYRENRRNESFPYLLFYLDGLGRYNRSAYNAVEYLWVSWDQAQGRPCFRQDSKSYCVYTCTQKRYNILKVRNALIKATSCSRLIPFAILFSRTSCIVTSTGHWLGRLRERMCIFKFVWHMERVS